MFWLGAGVAAIGAAIYAVLDIEEQSASLALEHETARLNKDRQARQLELDIYQRQSKMIYEQQQYIALYGLVLEASIQCYQHYKQQEQLLFTLNGRMIDNITDRLALMKKRENTLSLKDKQKIELQIEIVRNDSNQAMSNFEKVESQQLELEKQLGEFYELLERLEDCIGV